MIYLVSEKKMIVSYFVFAICIFIKPQALIFTPVLILGIIENLFLNDFDINKVLKNLAWGIGAIAMLVVLSLPFGLGNVVDQYVKTISEQTASMLSMKRLNTGAGTAQIFKLLPYYLFR